MRSTAALPSNVVPFRPARACSPCDQKSLMDAVYASGSLPVAADDQATKSMASRLQIFGFVAIDEVQADGSLRRLKPSEAARASAVRPWRLSKALFAWGSRDSGADGTLPSLLRPA